MCHPTCNDDSRDFTVANKTAYEHVRKKVYDAGVFGMATASAMTVKDRCVSLVSPLQELSVACQAYSLYCKDNARHCVRKH